MQTVTDPVTLAIVSGPDLAVEGESEGRAWEHNRYRVRLERGELGVNYRSMELTWKQGLGITDDPSAADVLENILLGASSYDNARGFDDWARDFGYDTDSRRAEKLYRKVGKQTKRLRTFLGDDYDATATEDAEEAARRLTGEEG